MTEKSNTVADDNGRERIARVSDALLQARRSGTAADAHGLSLQSIEEAYAVQQAVAQALGWQDSAAPSHWKSGSPSRADPVRHAALPPERIFRSPAALQAVSWHAPAIEAEIALRLGRELSAEAAAALTPATATDCIDAMAVAIEIVDSRWRTDSAPSTLLKLADTQSNGALVLGEWLPFQATHDWQQQDCTVRIDAQAPVERRGTHPHGAPDWLLCEWLRHATTQRGNLVAGTVVTTGSWVGILPVQAGAQVEARFEGLGSVRLAL